MDAEPTRTQLIHIASLDTGWVYRVCEVRQSDTQILGGSEDLHHYITSAFGAIGVANDVCTGLIDGQHDEIYGLRAAPCRSRSLTDHCPSLLELIGLCRNSKSGQPLPPAAHLSSLSCRGLDSNTKTSCSPSQGLPATGDFGPAILFPGSRNAGEDRVVKRVLDTMSAQRHIDGHMYTLRT